MGKPKILLCFCVIAFGSVLIPRVSYTSVRAPYRYRSSEINITMPGGWIFDNKPLEKKNGTRVLLASESGRANKTLWGVEVLRTPTGGARSTQEFFANRKKRWTFLPTRRNGREAIEDDWQLEEISAHSIEWHGAEQDHIDVYLLAPNGQGWHLEFFTQHGQLDKMRPVFESITRSITFG